MRKFSYTIFALWCAASLALVYTGPDTWRALLNGTERIFLPLFVVCGYAAAWAALGFIGRAAARFFPRLNAESSALFARLAFILAAEGYWQSRNNLLPAIPFGSPVKLVVLLAVFAGSILLSWFAVKTASRFQAGETGGGRGFSRAAGAGAAVIFIAAVYYVFVFCGWSFHLFDPGLPDSDAPAGPNLVMVTLDTTSANFTSLHGFPDNTTPKLNRLAERGVMFENAMAPMPVTAPSHSSMMTGLIPRVHGVVDNDSRPLGERFITLAEILAERGYQTAQFVNFQVCSTPGGLHQGFSTAFSSFTDMAPFRNAVRKATLFDAAIHLAEKAHRRILRAGPKDENYVLVRKWIGEKAAPPFFLWYHIFIPHLPYKPPDYAMKEMGYKVSRPFDVVEVVTSVHKGIDLGPERAAELRKMYAAEIFHADAVLGRVIADLDAAGLLENTLLVVTGDHGEAIYEHDGKIGHAEQVYNSVAKVPCVIWRPGKIPGGLRIKAPVSLTDLFPTILELLGVPAPVEINGRSLAGMIYGGGGAAPPVGFVITETMPPISPEYVIAVKMGNLHYLEWIGGEERRELYDAAADPFETKDLVAEPGMAENIRIMHDYAMKWIEKYPFEPLEKKKAADPGFLRQLKNLGYVK